MNLEISNALFFAIVVASLFCWHQAIQQGLPLIPRRKRIQSPLGLLDVCVVFICWVGAQILVLAVLELFDGAEGGESGDTGGSVSSFTTLLSGSLQLLATFVAIFLIGIRHGYTTRIFGWQPENIKEDLVLGFRAFVMLIPLVWMVQAILVQFVKYEHATIDLLNSESGYLVVIATWFTAVLVAPFVEELFFRGTLLAWMQRQEARQAGNELRMLIGGWMTYSGTEKKEFDQETSASRFFRGKSLPFRVISDNRENDGQTWLPIIFSSGFFAAIHVGQGPAPVALFLLAVGLGYIYRQTGSIVPVFVVHLLLNAFTMAVVTLQKLTT